MSCFKHKRPRVKRKKKRKKKKRDNKWSSDEARLPRLFTLAPIAGYNLKHIRLCSTALKELFIGFGNLFQSREEAARFYNIDFGQRNWQVGNEDEIDERKNSNICIYYSVGIYIYINTYIQVELWDAVSNIQEIFKKKKSQFEHSIVTDGISVSIFVLKMGKDKKDDGDGDKTKVDNGITSRQYVLCLFFFCDNGRL